MRIHAESWIKVEFDKEGADKINEAIQTINIIKDEKIVIFARAALHDGRSMGNAPG